MAEKAKVAKAGVRTSPRHRTPQGVVGDTRENLLPNWPHQRGTSLYIDRLSVAKEPLFKLALYYDDIFNKQVNHDIAVKAFGPDRAPPSGLPVLDARRDLRSKNAKARAGLEQEVAALRTAWFEEEKKLAPFDYEAGGIRAALSRDQIARHAEKLALTDRKTFDDLLETNAAFAGAVLETPAFLYGLATDHKSRIYEKWQRERWPAEMAKRDEEAAAFGRLDQLLRTTGTQLDAELETIGEPVEVKKGVAQQPTYRMVGEAAE